MTNLLLADEINRTSSKTQSALLEVMEEGQVTVDGETHTLPKPFVVIATQNPVGSAGTQLLPQAQLDRFMIRLEMGYPDFDSQVNILRDRQTVNPIDQIQEIIRGEEILAMQEEVRGIHVKDTILNYVTSLAMETRKDEMVRLGVSPRGALAAVRMAKAFSYLNGREMCIRDRICIWSKPVRASPLRVRGAACSTSSMRFPEPEADVFSRTVMESFISAMNPHGCTPFSPPECIWKALTFPVKT